MKKLFLMTTAAIVFTITSNAQITRKADPSQKVQSDSLSAHKKALMDELNLTPDQKSQMKAIHESANEQRNAIKSDSTLTKDEKRAKMKDFQKSQSQKINSILTPDQQAKRNAYIKNMKQQRKEQHKKSGATIPSISE